MRKILLPTDFSQVSDNAIQYALKMFGENIYKSEVEFTLFHAHHHVPPLPSPMGVPVMRRSEILEQANQSLDENYHVWKEKFPELTLNKKLELGEKANKIAELAKQESFDLVVVGSLGRSGIDRWLMGSTAGDIAKRTDCPVLVIPEKAGYRPLKKIVFATDFRNLKDLSILDPLRDVVKAVEPDFRMLHIYSEIKTSSRDKETMNKILDAYFDTERYKPFFLEHDDPAKGVEEFVKGYNADMLALVGQERSFLESLFHKSVTEQLLIHTEVPLFILNDKERQEKEENEESEEPASFKERMKDQMEKWKREIDELNVQLNLAKKEARDEWKERREQGRKKLRELQSRLDGVEDVAEDRWDHFRKEFSEAVKHLKKGILGK